MDLIKKIRNVPDFPKKGILFRDITTLLKDGEAFKQVVDLFYEKFKGRGIDYIAVIESRGYLFGAPLAYKLGCGLVIVRKPGKLPAAVERIEYNLEYGKNVLEIHKDAIETGRKVLVVDDLLATGGTAAAACRLIERIGGKVCFVAFLLELTALKGRALFPSETEVFSLLQD